MVVKSFYRKELFEHLCWPNWLKLFGFIVQDVSQKKEFNEKISVKVNKGEKKKQNKNLCST